MKKILCVFMAVMMLFSSVAVIGASAAEGYAAKNPITDSFDSYEEFVDENGDKEIYGYTYKLLYEDKGVIDWSKFDIHFEKDGIPAQSTRSSISLALSNMNNHFKRLMTNFFGGAKLHTEEYATDLANFIGKMLYPDFKSVTVRFPNGTTPNEDDFYKFVADASGIVPLIQTNWIDNGIDFKAFFRAFGIDTNAIISHTYSDGRKMGATLIKGAVNYMLSYGPLEAMYKVLDEFTCNYFTLYEATSALFSLKINAGKRVSGTDAYGNVNRRAYTADELASVEGLLSFVFDGVTEYEFFKYPRERIVGEKDKPEKILWLMMYFAINYKYKNNAAVIDRLAQKIKGFIYEGNRYSGAGYSYEVITAATDKIDPMIDILFKGDITLEAVAMLDALTQEHIDETPNDIFTAFKNWLSKLMRMISDYIDYVFKVLTGEHQYGQPMN